MGQVPCIKPCIKWKNIEITIVEKMDHHVSDISKI